MKDWDYIRIYGDREKITDNLYEVKYTEYCGDGSIHCTGTEDFGRIGDYLTTNDIARYHVSTWDGQKRNKGGFRWFTYRGSLRINRRTTKIKDIRELILKSSDLQERLGIRASEKIEMVKLEGFQLGRLPKFNF